ncbi:MAG: MBL fold metallo-hydrolase, partial [Pseudomonadota bacterium]
MAGLPPKPWPTGASEPLEPLVARVLAPNPSPYTYTGTQTYVVGAKDGPDCAVIDPGPNDPAHIAAIIAAVGERAVTAIMCTHTHRDHAPLARPFADRKGATIVAARPPVRETHASGALDEDE